MTEPESELASVLALCVYGYNERARQQLLALMPTSLAQQVAAQLRQGDHLLTSATGTVACRLAAGWLSLQAEAAAADANGGTVDEETPAEASRQVADEAPSHENLATAAGADGSQDAQIEAFFAAGDALSDDTADPEVQVSQLPATLVARLMIGGRVSLAADLLSNLPLALQGEVVVKIARSTALSVRRDLEQDEQPSLQALRLALPEGVERWGVQHAVEILRALNGPGALRRALGSAAEVDDQVVAVVQSHLFEFDDLSRLRDTELQALLNTCDNADLARALFEAAEPIRDRVIANISDRRAALLSDEADLHAEATPDEIDLSRRQIMAQARVLYERGVITTYFGSIGTEPEISPAAEPEEDEDEPSQERPASSRVPAGRPEQKPSRLVPAVLATGIAVVLLIGLVRWLTGSGAAPAGGVRAVPGGQGRGGGGRVAIAMTESRKDHAGSHRSLQLQSGQTLRVPAGAAALLEFPSPQGRTIVDADPGAQLQGLDEIQATDDGADPVANFYLRVGRVRVSVAASRFIVRTPTGQIEASAGSVFHVRVVLDGSMQVEANTGIATVFADGQRWTLHQTQGLAVDVDGRIERYQVAE